MAAYATVDEYRLLESDSKSDAERVTAILAQQSARLRADFPKLSTTTTLTDDLAEVCKALVCDAAHKALVPPSFGGVGEVQGASQASFSANGFQGSYTVTNPTGAAYWDRNLVRSLRRLLGQSQVMGTIVLGAE